jgi:hypothetical protein
MARMPPPGSDSGIAMSAPVPKSAPSGRMPPPGTPEKVAGAKASRDEAGFVGAENHCIDCAMYDVETGDCAKVEGVFQPDDACAKFFEAVPDDESQESGPDADDDSAGPPASGDDSGS